MVSLGRIASNWRLFVAAIGFLTLAATAHPQPHTQTKQDQSNAELQTSTARFVEAINNIGGEKDTGCQDREDKRGSNLCAQWKAADAARDAADYTLLAVFLSFVGTGLVAATFWEQHKVSRAELRAYVAVEVTGIFINARTGEAEAQLDIMNNGRTPAFKTKWAGNVIIRTAEQMERDIAATEAANRYPEGRATVISIHGDKKATASVYAHTNLTAEDMKSTIAGDKNLYVFGTVWYEDAFRKARYTNFCFEAAELPGPVPGRPVTVTPGGKGVLTVYHNDSN